MAIKLVGNYSKRLGLPGYSSHQFSVSVETELHDVTDIAGESARLYQSLQQSVDDQIQQTGFVPAEGYGRNGNSNTDHTNGESENGDWQCSGKQREFIERIVRENGLDKNEVEQLAVDLFGQGVKSLNRLAASGLIDQLLERYGRKTNVHRNGGSRRERTNDRAR
jgi:hypothetical protein